MGRYTLSAHEAYQWWFDQKKPLCFLKNLRLSKLHSKDGGFLVNDELKIVAEVNVLEVNGKADDASEGSQDAVQPMKKTKRNDYGTPSSDLYKETRVGNETVDVNVHHK
ncbi:hypothetical protein Bca4012_095606 [Brassica carinata]